MLRADVHTINCTMSEINDTLRHNRATSGGAAGCRLRCVCHSGSEAVTGALLAALQFLIAHLGRHPFGLRVEATR